MIDLIGRPYALGADGTGQDGAVDCIHLVYIVLNRLGIETPTFNPKWYTSGRVRIFRDLLKWGVVIDAPLYDGDVVLLPRPTATFAVAWNKGCLYINQPLNAVAWCHLAQLRSSRSFRMKGI